MFNGRKSITDRAARHRGDGSADATTVEHDIGGLTLSLNFLARYLGIVKRRNGSKNRSTRFSFEFRPFEKAGLHGFVA